MKRLAWLIAALLILFAFAHAELDAELITDAKGASGLRIKFVNDTGANVTGAKLLCGTAALGELPETVKAGETYTATFQLNITDEMRKNGYVNVRLEYAGGSGNCRVPFEYPGAKLYIQLPARPLTDGETVNVRYVFSNESDYDIKNAIIKASDGYESDSFSVKAGEYAQLEAPLKVVFPFSHSAEAVIGGRQAAKAAAEAEELKENVVITCASEQTAAAGEGVRITVNVENLGNTDYTMPVLREESIGEIAGLPAVIKAGSFTTVNAFTPALYKDTNLLFTFEGIAADGRVSSFGGAEAKVTVTGTAPDFAGAVLQDDPAGEPSFAVNALLKLTTLKGLPVLIMYVCLAASVVFIAVMLIKNSRRRKKR